MILRIIHNGLPHLKEPFMQYPQRLSNRIAIVTGSGRGLGAATALRLASEGANVVVNDINRENAEAVAKQITELGRKALVSTHDVSNTAAAQALVAEAKSTFGRVDILVNNAGITRDSLLVKMTEEKWDEVIRVNLKGPFNMGQACAKIMGEQNYGKIVSFENKKVKILI